MILENLQIGRIVMHDVPKRGDDRQPAKPTYGASLEKLSAIALGHFRARVTDALSAQSKSMEMRLVEAGPGSVASIAQELIAADDAGFLDTSRGVADALARAQLGRGVPGGMLIVFDGQFGHPATKFVGFIKAETQSGFRRSTAAAQVITEFLENIFLTPATRLYKIGFLVSRGAAAQGVNGWAAYVFDSNITSSHRESAAQYFYEGFLGCTFPENGPYETARFFDLTREFIRKSKLPQEQKRDLNDALFTFVKTEKAPTFTGEEFGNNYLPVALRDDFAKHLDANKFPTRAVVRDTSDMGVRLRRRRFKFGADIEFSISPDALDEKKATIEFGTAQQFGGEGDGQWTRITIRRAPTDQT